MKMQVRLYSGYPFQWLGNIGIPDGEYEDRKVNGVRFLGKEILFIGKTKNELVLTHASGQYIFKKISKNEFAFVCEN